MRRELPDKRRRDLLPNRPNISLQSNRIIQGFEVRMLFGMFADRGRKGRAPGARENSSQNSAISKNQNLSGKAKPHH
jgi:hypothetical protein